MIKFTDVLEEYLTVRDQLKGDYYDNMHIGARLEATYFLRDLANELNEMVETTNKE